VGYLDEQNRLWFCGRKAERVELGDETLFTTPCEAVFNTHPKVFRTALVRVASGQTPRAALCVELEPGVARAEQETIKVQLLNLGAKYPHTAGIQHILFHPGFPVDVRHNAKIGRVALGRWASDRVR